ncbi:MAG: valine--tRNA ligase [Nanoarchaeota archaeon]|nr:valine--tRNA ligase [Nanoarchaeota archaeon]
MAEETKKEGDYDFAEAEARILDFWEKKKIYAFDQKSKKKIFSIDTPPPTVSGKMHLGHAFMYSQMDFIARFHRMIGENVFYPFGTDDNGLPTERLVEKMNNVKSKSMDRGDFIELCLKTLKKITPRFVQDWKDIGVSADYDLYYSTIDKHCQKISQKSFIDLFKQGRVYKKDFPSLWCPECQTSIAQAELEDKEFGSLFSTLKFSVAGKTLGIATTRPELLPACVAVFVNPKDKRYKEIIGKRAKVPLFDFEVPIIADSSANMEKGTGVLMVCSYGDKYDAEAIARCKLEPKIVMNKDGSVNYGEYGGMKIKEARKKIIEYLKAQDLIIEQKSITHAVNVHDKCGTEIEILPTEQWFIKILDLKKKLIEQGKKINWHPDFMFKRYENWVNGLEWDWNISRDRHFGVPIPAWTCEKCRKVIVANESELPVDPIMTKKKCSCGGDAIGESKVFDTWQTSSITPQIAAALVSGIKIPYSVRCNAHDIIRTWDFYTITKSFLHENKTPWENIMVSGFVTLGGEKMSKSKGNVVEPQKIMETSGADGLRFWAASSKLGEDLDYQEKEIVSGKKFVTKIWNATKFVSQSLSQENVSFQGPKNPIKKREGFCGNKKPKKLEETDRLFLASLNKVIDSATGSFSDYEYSRAKQETMNFFWHVFCDNYLEIVKRRVYSGTKEEKESASYMLYQSLLAILKMMAPITPYITEEIYQNYFKKFEKDNSIHISSWPEKIKISEKKDDGSVLDLLLSVLGEVRMAKSKAQKSMKAEIVLSLEKEKIEKLKLVLEDLKGVVSAREIKTGSFSVEFL